MVDIPLVLHGASDVPDEFVRWTIKLGVTKVNVATELKIAFAGAVKAGLRKTRRVMILAIICASAWMQ